MAQFNSEISISILKLTKTACVLLSVLFVFNSCGFIFAFFQLSYIFKQEASQRISNGCMPDEISLIEDSPKVEKLDQGEIRLDGMKYDIVKTELRNGKTFFFCISDEKETNLEHVLINQIENSSNDVSSVPIKNIVKNLLADLLLPERTSNPPVPQKISYMNTVAYHYQIHCYNVPTHPPQIS